MRIAIVTVACLSAAALGLSAQGPTPLSRAATTLNVANVHTLQFTGSGANFSVGQNWIPTDPWPRVTVKNYVATINYDSASMRQELLREMGNPMPRGGGAPFFGEQRQTLYVSGNYAWNVAPPAAPGGPAGAATAQPAAQPERMLFLWATPQGFVKAAMANSATVRAGAVSFTVGGKYKMTGTLDAMGRVTKVQTWIDNPVVGDMLVETTFTGYKDFGGVLFPARIVQTQDGFPSLDLTISAVTINGPADIGAPEDLRTAPPPPPIRVDAVKIAEGVQQLTGGSHHSLAVEMRDHIVIADLPNNQARGDAVIAKAKELFPNKPVRFVITGHHHWDHLGGIRSAMAEGATIVTHLSNRAFLNRIAIAPHTLGPDRQSTAKTPAKLQTVDAKGELTDGTRRIELHLVTGLEHTGDMLLVYLPQEKVLAFADAFTPPATAGTPLVVTAVPFAKAVYDTVQRLKLDVQTIVPFHGNRLSTMAELTQAISR
jgi:glyoxylase-like metal-dependent hydrolase (beta-lactamase superfamily II)